MNLYKYPAPRTQRLPKKDVLYWDSPEFHLSWLQDFSSIQKIIESILSQDMQTFLRYSDLVYASWFSQHKITDWEDFYHHLEILTLAGSYKKLISCIRNFIWNSVTTEWKADYRHFDRLMLNSEEFSMKRYLASIQESKSTWEAVTSIERRKEFWACIISIKDTIAWCMNALPK